jgi:hypothetical protein
MMAERNHNTGNLICYNRYCERDSRERVLRVIKDADEMAKKLKEARNIDYEELFKPMDI